MLYIIIGFIICFYIFIFSMCYMAKKSDDMAEKLLNEYIKGDNNKNNSYRKTINNDENRI